MISEKEMEDQVAGDPDRFLGERGLKLVSRQLRVGSYIFDLLFEDRHQGKLIVELQKGSLDRTHTYKILDYYHEFRERNPAEFIDVMVVANQIPLERKKRLQDLGIEFKEIPEHWFAPQPVADLPNSNKGITLEASSDCVDRYTTTKNEVGTNHYFQSSGPSEFVKVSRNALTEELPESEAWELGGNASLSVEFKPVTQLIKQQTANRFDGLKAQIWMARPENGRTRCTFELMSGANAPEAVALRESFAASIRKHLVQAGLPAAFKEATRSTIVSVPLSVPAIKRKVLDDTAENVSRYPDEIAKIVALFRFLNAELPKWVAKQ